jgi:transcriptional repressor NrdR
MVCTYCGSETQVINSRHQKRSNSVWRRRKCIACKAIFSTGEQVDYEKTWVVQYPDSSLAPFLRDKLFISIHKACQHRPTALPDAIGLTNTIINVVNKAIHDSVLNAQDIAGASYQTLRRFDQPAAISYKAFHGDVL